MDFNDSVFWRVCYQAEPMFRLQCRTLSGCHLSVAVVLLLTASLDLIGADTLRGIQRRGVLRWGADAEGGAPYVYPNPDKPEQLIGFEVELADALAATFGVKAEMVQNQWDQLLPALERDNFDIILNGLESTEERRQRISLSRPYYAYRQQIVTRHETQGLTQLDDLRGRIVGVLSSSAAQRLLEKVDRVDLRVYPGNVESFRDLKAGRIEAVVLDLPIAIHYAKPDTSLKFAGEPFAPGYYVIGVRPDDATLLEAVNVGLRKLADDHTLERIYRKYGLWDDSQEHLEELKTEVVERRQPVSTLRDWPKYLPLLLRGAVTTVELSVLGMALAVSLGLAIAILRNLGPAPVRWLAQAYVEVIRGTPLLIQLFLIYYGLPEIGIRLNAFCTAILGLGLNYAASEAENYRAGIQAIPGGQTEAALALGMTRWQTFRHIVLPQALRLVIPPVTNDFIAMFKDSSIVSVITMVELTKVYGMLAMSTYDYIGLGVMTAGIYFALSYPASIFAKHLERKLHHDRC